MARPLRHSGFALLAALALQSPAMAQMEPGRDAARQLDAQRQKAEDRALKLRNEAAQTRADIVGLQRQLVALAIKRSAWQKQLGATEDALAAQTVREQTLLRQRDAKRASLMDFLAALERAGMKHPPALAVSPDDANAAARAASVLASTTPELRARADQLATTLKTLEQVREKMRQQRNRLQAQQKALQESTIALQKLLKQRRALERKVHKNADRAAQQAHVFAVRASTLRDLIAQLEAAARGATPRLKPPRRLPGNTPAALHPRLKPKPGKIAPQTPFIAPTGRFSDARGLLRPPVEGVVAHGFGQSEDTLRRDGMVIQARRGAQVTAPFDARILYAGPFRNLGHLLILSVGEGYHVILAGFGRSFVVPGQLVLAGEPVGEMTNRSRQTPELYLELQKNGRPLDPAPWLARNQGGG